MPKPRSLLIVPAFCLNALSSFSVTARTADEMPINTSGDSSSFYHETRLFDGKVSIMIPNMFSLMSEDLKAIKYPNAQQAPNVVYTNDGASVNIAFNLKNFPTTENDLPQIKEVFEKQLASVKPESFVSQIKSIDGHKYVVYEFVSQAVDTKIYNLMFLTDLDGKLLMGTFNCTVGLLGEWKPRAEDILKSVRKLK